ncbi:MAG: hypothetical protein ACE5EB_01860 [Thermodesulfobacteriota bacterium]
MKARWFRCLVDEVDVTDRDNGAVTISHRPTLYPLGEEFSWSAVYTPEQKLPYKGYEFAVVRMEMPEDREVSDYVIEELKTKAQWDELIRQYPHYKNRWKDQP